MGNSADRRRAGHVEGGSRLFLRGGVLGGRVGLDLCGRMLLRVWRHVVNVAIGVAINMTINAPTNHKTINVTFNVATNASTLAGMGSNIVLWYTAALGRDILRLLLTAWNTGSKVGSQLWWMRRGMGVGL